jgi:hypothetical protein
VNQAQIIEDFRRRDRDPDWQLTVAMRGSASDPGCWTAEVYALEDEVGSYLVGYRADTGDCLSGHLEHRVNLTLAQARDIALNHCHPALHGHDGWAFVPTDLEHWTMTGRAQLLEERRGWIFGGFGPGHDATACPFCHHGPIEERTCYIPFPDLRIECPVCTWNEDGIFLQGPNLIHSSLIVEDQSWLTRKPKDG